MRLNRITSNKCSNEFVFRVHGWGGIGAKADSLLKYGVCFLDRGIRVPNGHVISSSPYFRRLERRKELKLEKIVKLNDESKIMVEDILDSIDGALAHAIRSSFQGDHTGNGIYKSVIGPLSEGIESIETIIIECI